MGKQHERGTDGLTDGQRQAWEAVAEYHRDGLSPTTREIGASIGKSQIRAHQIAHRLIALGYLRRFHDGGIPRDLAPVLWPESDGRASITIERANVVETITGRLSIAPAGHWILTQESD